MKSKRAVYVCSWLILLTTAQVSANEQESKQLPSLTVYGYTSHATGVTPEADGSLTVLDSSPFQLQGILRSGFGTVLNLDLFFAGRSTNLNADGNSQLDDLLATVRYLREPVHIEIEGIMHSDAQTESDRQLAERRLEFVKNKLVLASRYKLQVESQRSSVQSVRGKEKAFLVDQFSLRIRNVTPEEVAGHGN